MQFATKEISFITSNIWVLFQLENIQGLKLPRKIVKSALGNMQTMTGQGPMQHDLTWPFFAGIESVLIKQTQETLSNLNQSMFPSLRSLLTN